MPENKKETNVDSVKKLGDFKATKLADLIGDISREKSRANVIMASIKAKRDALIAKAEDEAKAKAEAEAKAVEEVKVEKEVKAPEKKAEVKAETPAPKEVKAEKIVEEVKKVEPVKPVSKEAEAPKTQQKPAETPAKKIETPVQEAKKEEKAHIVVTPKTPFELAQENPEILPNGEIRLVHFRNYHEAAPTAEKMSIKGSMASVKSRNVFAGRNIAAREERQFIFLSS